MVATDDAGLVKSIDHDANNEQHYEIGKAATRGRSLIVVGIVTTEPRAAPAAATAVIIVAGPLVPLPFFGVVESVLQAARSPGYIRVIRVVVPLANDVDAPKAKIVIHVTLALPLDVDAVKAAVIALHDLQEVEI